ncbi:hypothetical protein CEXT_197001 [Caerostris extrusa]|uniref:Uncharacterized protein n=1 Tax=Caerostris extrusa TaxID=172846 RepID=A0AAV4S4W2_CAEEX|nr:hypothetical protein CEXT_197001 [Caerostris extrusa]
MHPSIPQPLSPNKKVDHHFHVMCHYPVLRTKRHPIVRPARQKRLCPCSGSFHLWLSSLPEMMRVGQKFESQSDTCFCERRLLL